MSAPTGHGKENVVSEIYNWRLNLWMMLSKCVVLNPIATDGCRPNSGNEPGSIRNRTRSNCRHWTGPVVTGPGLMTQERKARHSG